MSRVLHPLSLLCAVTVTTLAVPAAAQLAYVEGTGNIASLAVLLLSLGPEASWPCGLVIPG